MTAQIHKTYHINAPVARVWEALTSPELIKQYYFGTKAQSDWKLGSTIHYTGEWEGEPYHDKGIIEELEPEKRLTINHISSRTGLADEPKNYSAHTYELEPQADGTSLTLTQEDRFKTEPARAKAWEHWDVVMQGLNEVIGEEKVHAGKR